jgi:competence protein ComGC
MKKGFTLIEVLAVITLLGLLALLIMPNVLEQKNKKEKEVDEATKKILYVDAEKYIRDNNYNILPGNVFCVGVDTLYNGGYLSIDATEYNDKIIKVVVDNNLNYMYSVTNVCNDVNNS